MGLNNSTSTNGHICDFMDKALDSDEGIYLIMPSLSQATQFRYQCYNARKLDRRRSMNIYQPDDPLYNTSAYDIITLTLHKQSDGQIKVLIQSVADRLNNLAIFDVKSGGLID